MPASYDGGRFQRFLNLLDGHLSGFLGHARRMGASEQYQILILFEKVPGFRENLNVVGQGGFN